MLRKLVGLILDPGRSCGCFLPLSMSTESVTTGNPCGFPRGRLARDEVLRGNGMCNAPKVTYLLPLSRDPHGGVVVFGACVEYAMQR